MIYEEYGHMFQRLRATLELLLTKYIKACITYEGIQWINTLFFFAPALRDNLFNAFTHKNYGRVTPIQIGFYKEK